MADVRSKNLYELLGNDPELDPSRPPAPPAKAVDRPAPRIGKRDAPKEAPATQPRENTGRRGGRVTAGNDAAFRDRNAGRSNNRQKPTDEAEQQPARPRGGNRGRGDRQSRTGQTDTRKQVQQGWGGESGEKAWDDERVAENIAKADEAEPQTPAEEVEEADKAKSFADYLAEKAARDSLAAKPVRAANEGTKEDKKWASAKELKHQDEEAYIAGSSEKSKREKQRKEKNYLDVDMRFVEQPRPAPTGARGGRGGRGGDRAPRGDRPARGGDRAPRGAPRGGAPSAAPRGGRGGARAPAAAGPTVDEKNFPSLGGN
ncbi:Stm1 N-terminal domain-containing protein [Penicillium ucsense]|uniref:Stm1 N-terminal domain-containing protein n=1 Tax=Penicillium ucsense TaxID=2839758 RepID=A0A8J8WM41_9EURO|nr:Stm1 N-terminal domain-containing protein [Penicillium ucsense]KAF7733840.1 Stm1 N-terminal domain-containing protein [Penicillium ucsense]